MLIFNMVNYQQAKIKGPSAAPVCRGFRINFASQNWRLTMPDLSLAEFVERVSGIMPVVMREFFRQETNEFYKLKITLPQFVVLDMLNRQGESRMSDLARLINVSTAAMTGIVDRLVRDGYAKRMHDPGDRRIVKAALTAKGAKSVKDMIDHRKMLTARIFEMISQEEREEYLKILTHIRDHIMEKNH